MSVAVSKPSIALEKWRTLFAQQPIVSDEVRVVKAAALDRFIASGFPTQRDEEWKYTALRRLESRSFVIPETLAFDAAQVDRYIRAASGCCTLVFVNGRLAPSLSTPPADGSVQIRTLGEMLRTAPAEAAQLMSTPASHSLEDLNIALTHDGAIIDIAADANVETPVYVLHYVTSTPGSVTTHPLSWIRAGKNAKARVIEHFAGDDGSEYFSNAVTHIALEAGAVIEHYRLQEEGTRAFHIGSTHTHVDRDARFISYNIASGGSLARVSLDIALKASGAQTDQHGLFLVDGNRHLDLRTMVDHAAAHTQSTQDYRGIAADRGRGIFNGKVHVAPQSQKISAQQSSRNLLLNVGCEIDTKPALEIYADDVKCSHGATVGQLDNTALFYLRSRGVPEQEARSILTLAFAESVLERISVTGLRGYLEARLREAMKLHGRSVP
jgi:Fe-S cluster assembly protein SufD